MKGVWFTLLLLCSALPVSAVTYFNLTETNTLSLAVTASDPDQDRLDYFYSAPFNQSGEWTPTYGDAGIYKINVTVGDGLNNVTQEVLVVVARNEQEPSLDNFEPVQTQLSIKETESILFSVQASDLNQDNLSYTWYLDGVQVSTKTEILFTTHYADQGIHTVSVFISDGISQTDQTWLIEVEDVDLDALLLSEFRDKIVFEGDTVSYDLPDFDKYAVQYTLSPPLTSGEWETDYFSAGVYPITLGLSADGYKKTHTFTVTVRNTDRPPVFTNPGALFVQEQQTLTFDLIAQDPDNESVIITPLLMPDGATFEQNTFSWTPTYNTVLSGGWIQALLHRFNLLSWKEHVEFEAQSNNLTNTIRLLVVVGNTNRGPTLIVPEVAIAKEGEVFSLNVSAQDPDNDKLSFSFSGFAQPGEILGFNTQGRQYVKVTVSDGQSQEVRHIAVDVQNTNRVPILKPLKLEQVNENETLTVTLRAEDPDNEQVTFSLAQAPVGMEISQNTLTWTPTHDATSKDTISRYNVEIIATDGQDQAREWLAIDVYNVNRAPVINSPEHLVLGAEVGTPTLFTLDVTDADGEELEYTWEFENEQFPGEIHQRTFISVGTKEGVLTVSDGTIEVKKEFTVIVS